MQGVQEQCLLDRSKQLPTVDALYGYKLVQFYATLDMVYSKVEHVQSQEVRYVKSRYIVGCDGPGSIVSRTLKAKFDG